MYVNTIYKYLNTDSHILTVYGLDIFGILESHKVPKFVNFRENLIEFRVRKNHFLVVTVSQLGFLLLIKAESQIFCKETIILFTYNLRKECVL